MGWATTPSRRCAFGAQAISEKTLSNYRKELGTMRIYKKSKGKMINGKMVRTWIPGRTLTKDEVAKRVATFTTLLATTAGADWRRKADEQMLEKVNKLAEEQERQAEEQKRLAEEQKRQGEDVAGLKTDVERQAEVQERQGEEQKRQAKLQKALAEEQERQALEQAKLKKALDEEAKRQAKLRDDDLAKAAKNLENNFNSLKTGLTCVLGAVEAVTPAPKRQRKTKEPTATKRPRKTKEQTAEETTAKAEKKKTADDKKAETKKKADERAVAKAAARKKTIDDNKEATLNKKKAKIEEQLAQLTAPVV